MDRKKLYKGILALVFGTFIFVGIVQATNSQFCKGFAKGYSSGYKKASGNSLEPLSPLCPLQPLKGYGDPESDFEHGYIIGFEKGMSAG